MKTKTLLLTAALTAAGIASSMAQVYSVNAVGYVNVTLKRGYNLVNNPLSNGGNTLPEILPANTPLPDDTLVVTFNSSLGTIGSVDSETPVFYPTLGWEPVGQPLPPGKGFYLYIDPNTAPNPQYVITFVGEVMQSVGSTPLSNPIATNGRYTALGSQVPQTGLLTTELGLTPAADDLALIWDKTKTPPGFTDSPFQYYDGIGWSPDGENVIEPSVSVGDGFFLFRAASTPTAWTRVFNVNPTP
jgi:hypothetical protein